MRYKIETERVDLFDVSIIITMAVRLEKKVSTEELVAAFDKAVRAHEVLNSRVVIEDSGEAYYADNDMPCSSFIRTQASLSELISENERGRFRIEEGEWIRGFDSPDGLVFMMHHLAGDGKSLLYFIETFLSALAGADPEFVPFRNLTLDNLPSGSRIPFFYEPIVRSWNRKWLKDKKIFGFEDMDRAYEKSWTGHKTKTEATRYEGKELEKLIRSAKDAGVTLTSYLIADMAKDIPGKTDVGLAANGRYDANRSMGNQATGISVEFKYDTNKSISENARTVHNLMQKKLSNDKYRYFVLQFMGRLDDTLKDALNLEHAGYFHSDISSYLAELLGYGSKARDISVTNLTRADIPLEYGEHRITEIIFIPPVVSYAKNVIGIVTAGDVMYVTRHIYE
ncbi:MAG: hypothetical protein K5871_11120 [Lachnospiraceae bacterium]|nr:hypothetical protein [Lachnospiraceae bacterium]